MNKVLVLQKVKWLMRPGLAALYMMITDENISDSDNGYPATAVNKA